MKRLILVAALGLGTTLFAGCGGPMDEAPQEAAPAEQQGSTEANASVDDGSQNVRAAAYGCCAWCWNRDRYHLVEGVVSSCTERARDYCAVGDRGGLFDAAWTNCAP